MSALNAICGDTKLKSQTDPTDASFEGKILAHHAKAGYDYPTIRLPFTFSGLIGRSTRIYQTVHNGALAFLAVVSPDSVVINSPDECKNSVLSVDDPRLDMAEVTGQNPAESIVLFPIRWTIND